MAYHENSGRPPQGSQGEPILAVRLAQATDLTVIESAPNGQDNVWVVLQVDSNGRLRVHDDSGIGQLDDLNSVARDVRDTQGEVAHKMLAIQREILLQLVQLTGLSPLDPDVLED